MDENLRRVMEQWPIVAIMVVGVAFAWFVITRATTYIDSKESIVARQYQVQLVTLDNKYQAEIGALKMRLNHLEQASWKINRLVMEGLIARTPEEKDRVLRQIVEAWSE